MGALFRLCVPGISTLYGFAQAWSCAAEKSLPPRHQPCSADADQISTLPTIAWPPEQIVLGDHWLGLRM